MVNVPNYQGIFLRGYGIRNHVQNNGQNIGDTNTSHSSGQIGQIQGDAIKNIVGKQYGWLITSHARNPQLEFNNFPTPYYWASGNLEVGYNAGKRWSGTLGFSASRVVPTANENRPVNIAVRYFIKTRS